jgi:hypothetical protein
MSCLDVCTARMNCIVYCSNVVVGGKNGENDAEMIYGQLYGQARSGLNLPMATMHKLFLAFSPIRLFKIMTRVLSNIAPSHV